MDKHLPVSWKACRRDHELRYDPRIRLAFGLSYRPDYGRFGIVGVRCHWNVVRCKARRLRPPFYMLIWDRGFAAFEIMGTGTQDVLVLGAPIGRRCIDSKYWNGG